MEMVFSQGELAAKLKSSESDIPHYERGERALNIEAAKKTADLFNTTVGYLLFENKKANLLNDPDMLMIYKVFKQEDKEKICFTLDVLIHEVSNRKRYAPK